MPVAITLTEGFLLKLMEFDESRPFMEAKCKLLLFEFSVILGRSACPHEELYIRHASWLGTGTLTSSDSFVYRKEVNYLTRLDCYGFFFSRSSLLGPDLPEHSC